MGNQADQRTATDELVIDDPGQGLFKVHRSSMTSPEVLEIERKTIFDHCWLYLGHDSEVANNGDFIARTVARRPLLFTRDETGQVRAFINSCPHRGAQVCREGSGTAKRFTCFYHGWTFGNDGTLVALPEEESYADSFDRSKMGLAEAPRLEEYRGFLFVCFDPITVDLQSYLAGATEYLDIVADHGPNGMEVVGGTQEYSIQANWKLLAENSIDGYHAMSTHATYLVYLKELGTDLSSGLHGTALDLGNGHAVIEYSAPWARPVARWEPIWGEDAKTDLAEIRQELEERVGPKRAERIATRDRNLLIFPNLVVNDIMSITVRTFDPCDVGDMNVSAWAMAPIGELEHLRARRLDSFLTFLGPGGFATPDDVEALETCQLGFQAVAELPWSDISRGFGRDKPSMTDELQMQVFWRRWKQLTSDPTAARLANVSSPAQAAG